MGLTAGIIGAGIIGAGATLYSANQAAGAQTAAADKASQAQMAMYNQTAGYLSPFRQAGQNALTQQLGMAQTGFNFNPTMTQLEQTPGYQFTLNQGLKSTQSGAAARGLGNSGAALRAAADYSSGLASNTYQQQFQNALNQYQTNYNNLANISNLGESAAAGTGNAAISTGQSIGQNTVGAGNAQAAASMAMGNSISSTANNSLMAYMLSSKLGLLGSGGGA